MQGITSSIRAAGHSVVKNSLELNKDLRTLKKIFLSHDTLDHTGGLPEVLKLTGKVDVHAHPSVFLDRIHLIRENEKEIKKFVALPYKKNIWNRWAQFYFQHEFYRGRKKEFSWTGEVPRKTPLRSPIQCFSLKSMEKSVRMFFSDDQSSF